MRWRAAACSGLRAAETLENRLQLQHSPWYGEKRASDKQIEQGFKLLVISFFPLSFMWLKHLNTNSHLSKPCIIASKCKICAAVSEHFVSFVQFRYDAQNNMCRSVQDALLTSLLCVCVCVLPEEMQPLCSNTWRKSVGSRLFHLYFSFCECSPSALCSSERLNYLSYKKGEEMQRDTRRIKNGESSVWDAQIHPHFIILPLKTLTLNCLFLVSPD